MREKMMLLAIPFILFQVVSIGCSISDSFGKKTPADLTPAEEHRATPLPPDPKKASAQKITVVNDTVIDVFRQPDTQSERVTQAIYNQPVVVLEEKDQWSRVKVIDGYTGWVKSKYLDKGKLRKPEEEKFKLVVTAKAKKILSQPKNGLTVKEVVMGTELFCIGEGDEWYKVDLPEGQKGWIDRSSTIRIGLEEHILKTTAVDFITTAKKFAGTTYLWGGVSSWGIDCSGLTYICSRVNGVDLQRDTDQQINAGERVTIGSAKPGDLLFFSTNTDLKDVSHVGIFIGDGQFIHASKSKGAVVTGSLKEDYFSRRLVAVRRIF